MTKGNNNKIIIVLIIIALAIFLIYNYQKEKEPIGSGVVVSIHDRAGNIRDIPLTMGFAPRLMAIGGPGDPIPFNIELQPTDDAVKLVISIVNQAAGESMSFDYSGLNFDGLVDSASSFNLVEDGEQVLQTDWICIPKWSCGSWNVCTAGTQTRTCTDAYIPCLVPCSNCGTDAGKPIESQSCVGPVIFDDFEDGSIDFSKWNILVHPTSSAVYIEEKGYLQLSSSSGYWNRFGVATPLINGQSLKLNIDLSGSGGGKRIKANACSSSSLTTCDYPSANTCEGSVTGDLIITRRIDGSGYDWSGTCGTGSFGTVYDYLNLYTDSGSGGYSLRIYDAWLE